MIVDPRRRGAGLSGRGADLPAAAAGQLAGAGRLYLRPRHRQHQLGFRTPTSRATSSGSIPAPRTSGAISQAISPAPSRTCSRSATSYHWDGGFWVGANWRWTRARSPAAPTGLPPEPAGPRRGGPGIRVRGDHAPVALADRGGVAAQSVVRGGRRAAALQLPARRHSAGALRRRVQPARQPGRHP